MDVRWKYSTQGRDEKWDGFGSTVLKKQEYT